MSSISATSDEGLQPSDSSSPAAPTPSNSYWSKDQVRADLLSGLTVALALVPEAVAFAFVCGVPPLVGLYAAFIISMITSVFGGRPGMISGATGAVAVVVVTLVQVHGIQYLFATIILAGLLQMLAGVARLGKFIRLVPEAVMFGFVNGLAIVIFLAQKASFQNRVVGSDGSVSLSWMQGTDLWLMIGLVGLTMAVIWSLPKLTKKFPAPLAGILIVSALVIGLGLPTKSVGDLASISGGLPSFQVPSVPWNLATLKIIFPYAAIVASVGLIESLMTLTLIDEMTESRGRGNKECLALGGANILTGLFGGMGGCAMIGQSVINVNSGGRGRLSGISASLFLLLFILFGAPLIEQIPISALTGVMFMVVIGTFEWSSFRVMKRIPRADAFVIVLVSGITVIADLAIAVFVGVVASALVFAWQKSQHISASTSTSKEGAKVYHLNGPLFFASVGSFRDIFDTYADPQKVVIDFAASRVYGHAGLDAIDRLAERYHKQGKEVTLIHLSRDCAKLLHRAGDLVRLDLSEDPHYRMAVNELG
ncbi:MAG: SulP family inorganic anion transporter [Polyangiaceae bacterium]|nr:SulP family inorganic anion transporter [Polyangiaceae bacterium]